MILTDIDGVQFELEAIMIEHLRTRKKSGGEFTEVKTSMNDYLLVRETPAEIIKRISEEKNNG